MSTSYERISILNGVYYLSLKFMILIYYTLV